MIGAIEIDNDRFVSAELLNPGKSLGSGDGDGRGQSVGQAEVWSADTSRSDSSRGLSRVGVD